MRRSILLHSLEEAVDAICSLVFACLGTIQSDCEIVYVYIIENSRSRQEPIQKNCYYQLTCDVGADLTCNSCEVLMHEFVIGCLNRLQFICKHFIGRRKQTDPPCGRAVSKSK